MKREKNKEAEFDLPELEGVDEGTVARRIHISPGDSTCTSCEG